MKPLQLDNPLRANPVLWLIWALLGAAVIGGLTSLAIALRSADRELPAEYHWEGARLDRDFERARNAARHDVIVGFVADTAIGTCLVNVYSQPDDPETLTMMFTHANDARLDRVMQLRRMSAGEYAAPCAPLPPGRWRVAVEGSNWSIRTQLNGSVSELELHARNPDGAP